MYLKAREIAQGLRCDWSCFHPWYPYDLLSTTRDHMGCQGWIKILSLKMYYIYFKRFSCFNPILRSGVVSERKLFPPTFATSRYSQPPVRTFVDFSCLPQPRQLMWPPPLLVSLSCKHPFFCPPRIGEQTPEVSCPECRGFFIPLG